MSTEGTCKDVFSFISRQICLRATINYKCLEYKICLNACIVKMSLRGRTFAFMHLLSDSLIYCPLINIEILLSDFSSRSSRCFSDYSVLPEPFTP